MGPFPNVEVGPFLSVANTLAAIPRVETAADLPQATGAILAEVTAGRITPGEGHVLAGLLDKHRLALETGDLEARLTALETKRGKK